MTRVSVRVALPDLEVSVELDDSARWVGVFEGSVLVGLAEFCVDRGSRRARVFVPACVELRRLRIAVSEHPAGLSVCDRVPVLSQRSDADVTRGSLGASMVHG